MTEHDAGYAAMRYCLSCRKLDERQKWQSLAAAQGAGAVWRCASCGRHRFGFAERHPGGMLVFSPNVDDLPGGADPIGSP